MDISSVELSRCKCCPKAEPDAATGDEGGNEPTIAQYTKWPYYDVLEGVLEEESGVKQINATKHFRTSCYLPGINIYLQADLYETKGSYWPDVHRDQSANN